VRDLFRTHIAGIDKYAMRVSVLPGGLRNGNSVRVSVRSAANVNRHEGFHSVGIVHSNCDIDPVPLSHHTAHMIGNT